MTNSEIKVTVEKLVDSFMASPSVESKKALAENLLSSLELAELVQFSITSAIAGSIEQNIVFYPLITISDFYPERLRSYKQLIYSKLIGSITIPPLLRADLVSNLIVRVTSEFTGELLSKIETDLAQNPINRSIIYSSLFNQYINSKFSAQVNQCKRNLVKQLLQSHSKSQQLLAVFVSERFEYTTADLISLVPEFEETLLSDKLFIAAGERLDTGKMPADYHQIWLSFFNLLNQVADNTVAWVSPELLDSIII